jgi:hypothetical protein
MLEVRVIPISWERGVYSKAEESFCIDYDMIDPASKS